MIENCSKIAECEKILHNRTQNITLIGENVLTPQEVEHIGNLIKQHLSIRGIKYLKQYAKASVSHFLVWKGIYEYNSENGDFWSSVEESIGKLDAIQKTNIGKLFFSYLHENNLPKFSIPSAFRYVSNILIHGMIPNSNLEEYFDQVLIKRKDELPSTDYEGIKFYLNKQRAYNNQRLRINEKGSSRLINKKKLSISDQENLNSIPQAFPYISESIRRFLLYGNEIADCFFYNSYLMLEFGQKGTLSQKKDNIELSERIIDAFIVWWNNPQNITKTSSNSTTSINKHGRFRQPIIKFDYKDDLVLVLPQQTIFDEYINKVILEISDEQNNIYKEKISAYRNGSYIETEEKKIKLKFPATRYFFRLLNGSKRLQSWDFESSFHTDSLLFAFEYDSKKIIQKETLPQDTIIVVAEKQYDLKPESLIFEKGDLFGSWFGYRYFAVNIQDTEKPLFIEDKELNRLHLPVSEKRNLKPKLVNGNLLNSVTSNGNPVYSGELPSIKIQTENSLDSADWNLYITYRGETTLQKPIYSKLNDYENILEYPDDSTCVIPLSDESLLGNNAVGNFDIRITNDIEGIDYEFNVVFIPPISFEFDRGIYIPQTDGPYEINLYLKTSEIVPIGSKNIVKQINNTDYHLQTTSSEDYLKENFRIFVDVKSPIQIPVEFHMPKLKWSIEGLNNRKYESEFSDYVEVEEEVLFDSDSNPILIVNLFPEINGKCKLELGPTKQYEETILRKGICKFDLSKFSDTIRSNEKSIMNFSFDVYGNDNIEDVDLFGVQKWKISNIRHYIDKKEDKRIFKIEWSEEGTTKDKTLAFWKLGSGHEKLLHQENIDNKRSPITFEMTESDIQIGRYLLHFTKSDGWTPLVFPGENIPNSKEILIDIDNEKPLEEFNKYYDEARYIDGISLLKDAYRKNDHLKSLWLHKLNILADKEIEEAINVFDDLFFTKTDLLNSECFTIINHLLLKAKQQRFDLFSNKVFLKILTYMFIENYQNKKMYFASLMRLNKENIDFNQIIKHLNKINEFNDIARELGSLIQHKTFQNDSTLKSIQQKIKDIEL